MQSLQKFPPDINRSRRLDVSSIFYSTDKLPSIYENSSLQFIPFQRQRDGIGKLISKSKRANPQFQQLSFKTSRSSSEQIPKTKEYYNEQDQKISRIVGSFFKKIDMETKQLERSKIAPKLGVVFVDKDRKNAKPTNDSYDIEIGLDKIKLRKRDCLMRKETQQKNNSLKQLRQKSLKMQKNLKENGQNKLQKLESKSQKKLPRKKESIEKIPKTKLTFQHPELKRYRQFKKLEIKVFSDYEVGHEKFKQKMQKSKMIAHRIKKQLQLE